MNSILQEWEDAVNATSVDAINSPHARRLEVAGRVLAADYIKAVDRANREAKLAVALRNKLEEVAGPDVASSITADYSLASSADPQETPQ